ncbi:MAG: alpha/beta hydrolase [Anaerovoracaceae bacterium]|jgi:predicted alpha/beta superfamily hydrolase
MAESKNEIRTFKAGGRTVTVYRAGGAKTGSVKADAGAGRSATGAGAAKPAAGTGAAKPAAGAGAAKPAAGAGAAEARGAGAPDAPGSGTGIPVIYLNTFRGNGSEVVSALEKTDCPEITLAVIGDLEWDNDMAPWDIPPIMEGDTPCTGGADDYLKLLTEQIIPETESGEKPAWRGLAGYSLAGLFAVYTMYRSYMFSRIATMSGSLWFPDFAEFATENEPVRRPDRLYMSLGSKEDNTRNRYLRVVRKNTEKLYEHYRGLGIDATFEINPGSHYANVDERTAAGIAWIAKGE